MSSPRGGSEKRVPVSVVIPCYFCADTIERAVESVMAQTAMPSEVVLVEDGSDDEGRTLAKLYKLKESYGEEAPIKVIPLHRNFGPAVARNAGWSAASQTYIAFLDADDTWHNQKLEVQCGWMQSHPEVDLTSHGWHWVRPNNPVPSLPKQWRAWKVSRCKQLLSNRVLTPTAMVRRKLPYRFHDIRPDSEGELWLRIVLDGRAVWRLELPLVCLYKAPFGESGVSGNLWEMEKMVVRDYWRQVRERRISPITFLLLLPWLKVKFVRRLVLSSLQNRTVSS